VFFLYPNLEERQVKSMVYTLYKPNLWGYLKGNFLSRVNFFYTKAIKILIAVVLGALLLADSMRCLEIPYSRYLPSVSKICSTMQANLPLYCPAAGGDHL
jgi:hypothetical protein